MLRWRVISAVVIVALLGALVGLDFYLPARGEGGLWLVPLLLIISLLAAGEMLDLLSSTGTRPRALVIYAGVLLMLLAACAPLLWRATTGKPYPAVPLDPLGWPLLALAASAALVFIVEMAQFREPGAATHRMALALLTIVYIGGLLSFLPALRLFRDHATGMTALLSTIIVVKSSDIGAYTVGRICGRHQAVPRLSPKKTIEGVVGGVVTACLVAWLVFTQLAPRLIADDAYAIPALWQCLLFGLVVALAGFAGDLAISLIKRDVGRKDSSTWLPGLGGVLDVLDSLMMAAPVAYLWWLVFGA